MGCQFVSYDGEYPNLCRGTLVLCIDGKNVTFPPYCMTSGGGVWFDDDWCEHVDYGAWKVDVPEEYKYLSEVIHDCVNANVPYGCCGGCV